MEYIKSLYSTYTKKFLGIFRKTFHFVQLLPDANLMQTSVRLIKMVMD